MAATIFLRFVKLGVRRCKSEIVRWIAVFIGVIGLVAPSVTTASANSSSPLRVLLSNHLDDEMKNLQMENQDNQSAVFDCSETIYAITMATQLDQGEHLYEVEWKEPGGKTREKTRYVFYTEGGDQKIWSWLKLNRPQWGTITSIVDPALGMREFIGKWKVSIYLDERLLERKVMQVIC